MTRSRFTSLSVALFAIAAFQVFGLCFSVANRQMVLGGVVSVAAVAVMLSLSLAATLLSLWRVALVARYRPVDDVGDAALPTVTVIVPAYNEGRQVLSTLRSLALSRYPKSKLQLIAVDDGSADDTWRWIREGHKELGALITPLKQPQNMGKKHALAAGLKYARGEVIVTVDSDSEVLPDTLRLLVAPLVHDAACGAVAGNVRVLNREAGIIPKMLDAVFTASFDFVRAGESQAGSVLCSPGALSAWRADIMRSVVDEWLAQTFFGSPAAIGEDRAMTNLVLRSGYDVRYQSTAVVLTQVPVTAKVLCKMFLRWARSNVRESIVMGRFIARDKRRGLQLMYAWSVMRLFVNAAWLIPGIALFIARPHTGVFVGPAILMGVVPVFAMAFAQRGARVALWALPWAVYGLVVTGWIAPYALLTMHKSGWLTRTCAKQALPAEALHAADRTRAPAFARAAA